MIYSLRTRLLASFLIAITLPLAVLGLYAVQALERATLDHLLADLTANAQLAAAEVAAEPIETLLEARITRWAHVLGVRIAVTDYRGQLLIQSAPLPRGVESEPGIGVALRGAVARGEVAGRSGGRWFFVAVPVERGGLLLGAVDLLLPLHSVEGLFTRVRWTLAVALVLAIALAAGLALYLSQSIFGPVAEMKAAAERIGAGDLHQRLPERPDELGDLARVLNAMARQLDERETMRRDFLANVSHELRTPVANIQFTAEALLAGAAEDPVRRRQMLETIAREADRLARLVRQLLDLLRIQSGRLPLSSMPVAVAELLEDAVSRFAVRAEAQGVALESSVKDASLTLDADPDRLAEVLDNLVDNALRSTPRGGRVQLQAWPEGETAVLAVSDTGTGIPPADLPFVFEKFYRAGAGRDRESGGSGLGLSIVKAIVEAHGGQITVRSHVGAGTTFEIRLPQRGPERLCGSGQALARAGGGRAGPEDGQRGELPDT
jgi:signal transduction histidine kinase